MKPMDSKNYLRLDFADNPEIKEYFQKKAANDRCRLEIEVQVVDVSQDGMDATVEEIVLPDDAKESKVKPGHDTPISVKIVLAGKGKEKEKVYEAA